MISKMLINKNNSNSSSTVPSVSNIKMECRNSGKFNTIIWILAMTTVLAYFGTNIVKQTEAYPVNLMMPRKYPVNVEVENPEELISTLDNLIQNILVGIDSSHSNNLINVKSPGTNKRGIDLGLSRGFSGSQAAKHLMGMSAASFANGPGRKR